MIQRPKFPPSGDYGQLKRQTLPAGRAFYRINESQFSSALHFATGPDGRWNAGDDTYGVLYAAESFEAAFCETFGHGAADRFAAGAPKFVGEADLGKRALFTITPTRDLRVATFFGEGLAKLNLDARFCANIDYTESQAWSRWVYDHHPPLDGLIYHSRHLPNSFCVALFEHCRQDLQEQNLGAMLELGNRLWSVMEELGWGLV